MRIIAAKAHSFRIESKRNIREKECERIDERGAREARFYFEEFAFENKKFTRFRRGDHHFGRGRAFRDKSENDGEQKSARIEVLRGSVGRGRVYGRF